MLEYTWDKEGLITCALGGRRKKNVWCGLVRGLTIWYGVHPLKNCFRELMEFSMTTEEQQKEDRKEIEETN